MSYEAKLDELFEQYLPLSSDEKADALASIQGWYRAEATFIDSGVHRTQTHRTAVELFIRALTEALADTAKRNANREASHA